MMPISFHQSKTWECSSPAVSSHFSSLVRKAFWAYFAAHLSLMAAVSPAAADPVWTWQAFTFQNDVWLRSYADGKGMFDFRLGAGGAIAEMRDVQAGYKRLLSPSFQGEATDRIIQWTCWSDSITHPITGLPSFEHRFNITQGGDFSGQITPTLSVCIRSGVNIVDVYSVPQDQWKTQQQAHMQSKFSTLTRYEMADGGVLKIRRVILVDRVYLSGAETQFAQLYLEGWSPFDRSGTFDGLALSLDSKGDPNWWYQAGSNIPNYPSFATASTHGYAVVYQVGSHQTHTAVGLVFGRGQVNPATAGNAYVLNMMSWDNGIGILPAIRLSGVALGSVIDSTIAVLPHSGLNAEMSAELSALVPQIPAPVVHPPTADLGGELGDIVARLQANLLTTGVRTQNLAGLVVQPGSPLERWRLDHFGDVRNTGRAADLADSDGDGSSNLLEYAASMNPNATDKGPVTSRSDGDTLEFVYTKNKAATDVTCTVEWRDDMSTWNTVGVTSSILSETETIQQIKASVPVGAVQRFMRLKVTRP